MRVPAIGTGVHRADDLVPALHLRAAVRSDVGELRDTNEDAVHVDPEGQFFVVADGMGGHAAGEIASALAIEVVRRHLEDERAFLMRQGARKDADGRTQIRAALERAVRAAQHAVYDRSQREADKHQMGTTLEVVVILEREVFVAHVGDSRTYLVRDGVAVQLTRDHTMAQALADAGRSEDVEQPGRLRNTLFNVIGVTSGVRVDHVHRELAPGDRVLLCSDGLYEYFSPEELAAHVGSHAPEDALLELVYLARARGGHDNISGIVIEAAAHPHTRPRPLPAVPPQPRPSRVYRAPTPTPTPRSDGWDEETTLPKPRQSTASLHWPWLQ